MTGVDGIDKKVCAKDDFEEDMKLPDHGLPIPGEGPNHSGENPPDAATVAHFIENSLIVLSLGAFQDPPLNLPAPLRRAVTLVRLDANDPTDSASDCGRLIQLRKIVADRKGNRRFTVRAYPNCSSLLEPDEALVRAYGLQGYFAAHRVVDAEATTLPEILELNDLPRFDYLKTDLEGMDHAVVESAGDLLSDCLMVIMEVRFQPFYSGEPAFEDTMGMMKRREFELLALHPEVWKYETRHRDRIAGGRTVMADAVFVRCPDHLRRRPKSESERDFVRQVVLLWMEGYASYAEYLLEEFASGIPRDVHEALIHAMFPDGEDVPKRVINPDFPHVDRFGQP
ncbi:MAG: FkbM family methyltransferase [Phycisphaerae bacterium]